MEKLVRKIGLVAHDAMKKDLIEWVLWNSELLMGHKFYFGGIEREASRCRMGFYHSQIRSFRR